MNVNDKFFKSIMMNAIVLENDSFLMKSNDINVSASVIGRIIYHFPSTIYLKLDLDNCNNLQINYSLYVHPLSKTSVLYWIFHASVILIVDLQL